MVEFLAAAREAGRTERRQRRRLAAEDARAQGRQSPLRWQQDHIERISSPSPRRRRAEAYESSRDSGSPLSPQRGVSWGEPPARGSVNESGGLAVLSPQRPPSPARGMRPTSPDWSTGPSSPQRGVDWGAPPVRGSMNESGGMAVRRPPSPLGSPRRSISPFGSEGEQQDYEASAYSRASGRDYRAGVDVIVQRRASYRLSSPTSYRSNSRHSRRQAPQAGVCSRARVCVSHFPSSGHFFILK